MRDQILYIATREGLTDKMRTLRKMATALAEHSEHTDTMDAAKQAVQSIDAANAHLQSADKFFNKYVVEQE